MMGLMVEVAGWDWEAYKNEAKKKKKLRFLSCDVKERERNDETNVEYVGFFIQLIIYYYNVVVVVIAGAVSGFEVKRRSEKKV